MVTLSSKDFILIHIDFILEQKSTNICISEKDLTVCSYWINSVINTLLEPIQCSASIMKLLPWTINILKDSDIPLRF